MKKMLILPECEWILTEEAKSDKALNQTDKNVLAVLQCMFDNKWPLDDGFYAIVLRANNNADYTLEGTLNDFGFKINETTMGRSINKLRRLGYLDYKRGFFNAKTNSGQPPKIKILKGTVNITDSMTDHFGVIADTKDVLDSGDVKLSTGVSDNCSVIADTKNIEQEQVQESEQIEGTSTNSTYGRSYVDRNCEKGDSRHDDSTRLVMPWEEEEDTEQPQLKLSEVLDNIEWGIADDIWWTKESFDLAFQNLRRKYNGLTDDHHSYLEKMFAKRQMELEMKRHPSILKLPQPTTKNTHTNGK